jgi:hypothetical protein
MSIDRAAITCTQTIATVTKVKWKPAGLMYAANLPFIVSRHA